MKVKVRYFTTLRELTRLAEEEIELEDNCLLRDFIEKIVQKYGDEAYRYLYSDRDKKIVDPSVRFLIKGKDSRMLKGLETKLEDGNIIAIIPPIGGGNQQFSPFESQMS
ncbi:MoaD family protein [Candidatus Bathyarchaeota archaeon]|nr:MoaD family protein [Candidatus Bathyarchaeota archaeon]